MGLATIRDQKPLDEPGLRRSLLGMAVGNWYRTLSGYVFFWPRWDSLLRMAHSPEYRDNVRLVLTLDTQAFLDAAGADLRLSAINLGYARRNPARRGPWTFATLGHYPARDAKEVAVPGGLEGAANLVIDASELLPGGTWRKL